MSTSTELLEKSRTLAGLIIDDGRFRPIGSSSCRAVIVPSLCGKLTLVANTLLVESRAQVALIAAALAVERASSLSQQSAIVATWREGEQSFNFTGAAARGVIRGARRSAVSLYHDELQIAKSGLTMTVDPQEVQLHIHIPIQRDVEPYNAAFAGLDQPQREAIAFALLGIVDQSLLSPIVPR